MLYVLTFASSVLTFTATLFAAIIAVIRGVRQGGDQLLNVVEGVRTIGEDGENVG